MNKHTPGPWRNEYPVVYAISGARLLNIDEYDCATVYDADLIAAAPDLLEACERLVRQFGNDGIDYSGDHPIAIARTAIAKATGGDK